MNLFHPVELEKDKNIYISFGKISECTDGSFLSLKKTHLSLSFWTKRVSQAVMSIFNIIFYALVQYILYLLWWILGLITSCMSMHKQCAVQLELGNYIQYFTL